MTGFEHAKTDSSLGVLTPEGIEFALFPAGLPIRTCAWGIDKLLQWAILVVFFIAAGFMGDAGGRWVALILMFCVEWFYHCICELLFRGQSLGKRIMGIRVVRDDGSPVNPGASFLRNLLRFADTFLFLCPIALISMMVSPGFRRLGDWAAGTLVVYTAKSLSPPRRSAAFPAGNFPPPLSIPSLSYEEKQAILMFARRYPLLGAARADDISRPYAQALEAGGAVPSAYLLGLARKFTGEGL
ncbi:MAG: RDD family protein [Treponema sp.]|jgi:uncharacterized RDD family membrane protein YckC|nr:RDD family protein [Treponema sp.]